MNLLILLWNLILVAGIESFLYPSYLLDYSGLNDSGSITNLSGTAYSLLAFLFLFYPLAGCLADIRCGRYKTVVNSVCVVWGSLVAIIVLAGVAIGTATPLIKISESVSIAQTIMIVVVSVMFLGCLLSLPDCLCFVVLFLSVLI